MLTETPDTLSRRILDAPLTSGQRDCLEELARRAEQRDQLLDALTLDRTHRPWDRSLREQLRTLSEELLAYSAERAFVWSLYQTLRQCRGKDESSEIRRTALIEHIQATMKETQDRLRRRQAIG